MQALAFLASLAVPSAGVLFALLASFAVGYMEAKRADPEPASAKSGIDEASCKSEAKYQCAYECIETSASPTDRNACEVKCGKRPLSHWNGKIPACTP